MDRNQIEAELGRKVHQSAIQSEICRRENEKLQQLNKESNELDKKLKELDKEK